MPYRPQIKTANGMVDFPLDAETVKGKTILEQTYPVGAIYMSVNNTSPASLFGGTWLQLKDRFLLGAGDTYVAGATGGSASHSHTLNNGYAKIGYKTSEGTLAYREIPLSSSWENNVRVNASRNYDTTTYYDFATGLGGSTDSANNMPPYLVIYMWKRTA